MACGSNSRDFFFPSSVKNETYISPCSPFPHGRFLIYLQLYAEFLTSLTILGISFLVVREMMDFTSRGVFILDKI